ncbi:MAG: efflux RND transporter periplasmic adaptor subunit [Acidobacteriota bacterium]
MRRRWWIVLILLVAGAGSFMAMRRRGELPKEVSIETVARGQLVAKVSANGQLEAKRKVDLSANVMGQITDLRVKEGAHVEKGDLLLQIDQTQLAASAAVAEASMSALEAERDAAAATAREARQAYDRAAKSHRQDLIPSSEVDRARAASEAADAQVAAVERRILQARASLTGARDSLSKTRIVAPISGTVTRLPVEQGEVAVVGTMNNAGTVLMTISDLSVVEAVMEVDETDVPSLAVGQEAEVTIDAYANRTFRGVVTEIGSSPVQKTPGGNGGAEAIDFEVKIELSDPPENVRPGFSCSAEIRTGHRDAAIAVPVQALVVRDKPVPSAPAGAVPAEEEGLYVFDGSHARFVTVKTGITGETRIEILDGVHEGDRIVTGPFRMLRELKDGDLVREAPKKAIGSADGAKAAG